MNVDVEALEIAPGESPFRMKGSAFIGHLDYVKRFVAGGLEAHFAGFRDQRQAQFLQQQHFLPSSFYDILPLVAAGYVCARQARISFTQFIRMRSRFQAERDIEGVYRTLLKISSPQLAISRLPTLQAQYFDFPGHGEAEVVEPGKAVMGRRQLPVIIAKWFTVVYETYIEVILEASGAKTVLVRSNSEARDVAAFGFPTVRYRCEVLWQ
jgi:hypothetical protein